jgi:hypothetical protein
MMLAVVVAMILIRFVQCVLQPSLHSLRVLLLYACQLSAIQTSLRRARQARTTEAKASAVEELRLL